MKIANVKAIPLECTLDEPFGFSQGWYHKRQTTIIEIITDEGIEGYGECFGPLVGQKVMLEQFFKPLLIGEDPLSVEALWYKLYGRLVLHFRHTYRCQ